MRVLNFGSLNLDYVYAVERFVRPGETLSASSREVKCGGKGLNQSVALARAGAKVWHAGCLGDGGEPLRRLLAENGVDVSLLRAVDAPQGHTVIQVDGAGENCILLYGGSNRRVTPAQIEDTLSRFGPGDWLVLQNEINGNADIVARAHALGLRVALNPSPFNDALSGVDFGKLAWLLVNEVEAEQLTGTADPDAAWRWLHGRWPGLSLLVTLGAAGSAAWRVDGDAVTAARQPAFPARAVDTTAAGDTYTGYFIAGLTEGLPLQECMRRASRAAAISVTRPGAAESIPARDEVL